MNILQTKRPKGTPSGPNLDYLLFRNIILFLWESYRGNTDGRVMMRICNIELNSGLYALQPTADTKSVGEFQLFS